MKNLTGLTAGQGLTLGNAQLAEGTNAATIKTSAAIDYMIGELLYSKAATDNIALTACAVQAAGKTAIYSLFIDSAGNITTVKGTEQTTGSGEPLTWAAQPANSSMIGAIKVVNTTNPFTAGTTDLSAAGVTATYYNLMGQPSFVLQA